MNKKNISKPHNYTSNGGQTQTERPPANIAEELQQRNQLGVLRATAAYYAGAVKLSKLYSQLPSLASASVMYKLSGDSDLLGRQLSIMKPAAFRAYLKFLELEDLHNQMALRTRLPRWSPFTPRQTYLESLNLRESMICVLLERMGNPIWKDAK